MASEAEGPPLRPSKGPAKPSKPPPHPTCHNPRMPTAHYVYILRCRDNSYYVGTSQDPEARLAYHNQGKGGYHTRRHRPVVLLYHEGPYPITTALKREQQIKNWSRTKKEALIKGTLGRGASEAEEHCGPKGAWPRTPGCSSRPILRRAV